MMIEIIEELKKQLEELKKQLKEEMMPEIKAEFQKSKQIKVLNRDDLMEMFNCNRTKMNQIMHSKDKPPVVYIGGEYYSTERQMKEYFNSKMRDKKPVTRYNKQDESDGELHLLHKKDLMDMLKMKRTKFKKFIDTKQLPIKIIGQEYYIDRDILQAWFYDFEGKRIDID